MAILTYTIHRVGFDGTRVLRLIVCVYLLALLVSKLTICCRAFNVDASRVNARDDDTPCISSERRSRPRVAPSVMYTVAVCARFDRTQ